MYTTLAFLKQNSACKPGYTEMIQFFGASRKLMDVPLPLGLCSMVLEKGNFDWMTQHAMIVDEDQYKAFRQRWLVPFMQWFGWEVLDMKSDSKRACNAYVHQMRTVETYEQAEGFIQHAQWQAIADFWLSGEDDEWDSPFFNPVDFIRAVVSCRNKTWGTERRAAFNKNRAVKDRMDDYPRYFIQNSDAITADLFETDPYGTAVKFLSDHPEISRKVVKNKLSFVHEKPVMTLTLEDPRRIFNAYRMLSDTREVATASLNAMLNGMQDTANNEYAEIVDSDEDES